MRHLPNLSDREPLLFILFLVLMAVLVFGGRERRHAYDAEHGRPTQMQLDATKHGPLAASATDLTGYNSVDVEWQRAND